MDEWDAQKMLDLYIYDYLVRKNMHTTAGILAEEADLQPKSVVINPPEGFLSEWWSLFWDVYSSKLPKNPQGEQASTSKLPMNGGPVLQNPQPGSLVPDVSYMLQNICQRTPMSGLPNLLQIGNPTQMPNMGSLLQNAFPTMMPKMDFTANQFRQKPMSLSDYSIRDEQILDELAAQREREQEHLRLPRRCLDPKSNLLNVDHLASMLPLPSSSSHRQKKVSSKRQCPVINDVNYSTGSMRSIPSELTPYPPKLIQDDIGHADAGSSASSNSACPDTSS